ncbi:hypothetical protein Aca07nite_55260 [Actinoplanes capillaceus]|uniref:Uncharacterized protein n=1 Tax=Actinoplanes campanulatus TaxID=113559 RepID=A0ABQ3WPU5_9ACTN|nr:hypothetical protein [Actinoplanes capillaceus]GID48251.1 hypothetical protein Aca07nite_55260 [Actinoplanes capillaceus]
MTDHWDFDDDFDDLTPDDVPGPDPLAHADHVEWELPDDLPDLPELPDVDLPDLPDVPDVVDAVDDAAFPPTLDIGELPEPVDGFPWVDADTLGAADPSGFTPPVEPVTAGELAAYAGVEIPPGADPWTFLASSEDPATAALAQWWTQGEQ